MSSFRPRDFVRKTQLIEKTLKSLINAGYACAFVYGTDSGIMKIVGSEDMCSAIVQHGEQLTDCGKEPSSVIAKRVCLPPLSDSIDTMHYHALRRILRALCLIDKGSGEVCWGKPEARPLWWPADVEWTDTVTKQGTSVETMRRLVTRCYRYYNTESSNNAEDPSSSDGSPATGVVTNSDADTPVINSDPDTPVIPDDVGEDSLMTQDVSTDNANLPRTEESGASFSTPISSPELTFSATPGRPAAARRRVRILSSDTDDDAEPPVRAVKRRRRAPKKFTPSSFAQFKKGKRTICML